MLSCVSSETARERLAKKCSEQFPCATTKVDTFLKTTTQVDTFFKTHKVYFNVPCPPTKQGDTSRIIKVEADCPQSETVIRTVFQDRTILKTVEDSAKIVVVRANMRDAIAKTVMLWSDSTTVLAKKIAKLENKAKIYKWGIVLVLFVFIILYFLSKIKR